MDFEIVKYDVLIVGAGPAGLSAAIKLKQLASKKKKQLRVCILEKGAQVGAHLLSGAVLDPRSLKSLLPESWEKAPLDTPVRNDLFYYLNKDKAFRFPVPDLLKNNGNYIISLGELGQFLALQAESLGCEVYSGFAASRIIYNKEGRVIGAAAGDFGIDKSGKKTENFQPGLHIHAKLTLLAEGCRGSLSQQVMNRFQLRKGVQPQTYALGIKELWEIKPNRHQLGQVIHTVGWPLSNSIYGGSFVYHLSNYRVALGLVVGLDYKNTWLDPFSEMQRFKTHPLMRDTLQGGERIKYGARTLSEGGWQSLPKLVFPGGMFIGDAAGFLNVPRIKGIHMAMQSGMFAAEACFEALKGQTKLESYELIGYPKRFRRSWMAKELYKVRNIRPGFRYGLWIGLANAAFEMYLSKGRSPWTLSNAADHVTLRPANRSKPIEYPKPDGKLTFDKLSSVYLSNTFHEDNQPSHLKLRDETAAITINYQDYASPETRYCPANVYEINLQEGTPQLVINAQNCIHCKACDIKDPSQNIRWTVPEGGGGPNYMDM